MKANEFAAEIVVPTVREFRDDRGSRRRTYLACITVYQLKEYLKREGADVESAMKDLGSTRSFEAVRAVCTAAKHGISPGREKFRDNIPFAAGEDYYRPPAIAGQLMCGLSRLGDIHGGREIAWDLGGLDLYDSVKSVLKNYHFHFEVLLGEVDFRDC